MALTVEQITRALQASAGNVKAAADALNVTRSALYKRIKESPTLQQALTDERESFLDITETALRREVLGGNITAIIFTLKTLGKGRGYVERNEHVHSGNLDVRTLTDEELENIVNS